MFRHAVYKHIMNTCPSVGTKGVEAVNGVLNNVAYLFA